MGYMKMGVFGTSQKKNEKRVPIHPDQIHWIDEEIRNTLYFESGYGSNFGMSDDDIAKLCGGVLNREELFEQCQIALIAKPTVDDFKSMKPGTVHWGWPHCVQQFDMTQVAIDHKLTLIAWEAMHKWSKNGDWQMHIFYKNNEIAGYAGVMHAMNLKGTDGHYGPPRKAVILSFGSVSRGAVRALQARGINDITVFTQRHYVLVGDQVTGIDYYQFDQNEEGTLMVIRPGKEDIPFVEMLEDVDIIVNGVLQDTDAPIMFVDSHQYHHLKRGCLIIDISCDEGMGFSFAKPTTFDNPMFKVDHIDYYAVDHTPSYLWDAASWEISNSLIPYLPHVMGGPKAWIKNNTVAKAIEIQDGTIVNPKILTFQNRDKEFPHQIMDT